MHIIYVVSVLDQKVLTDARMLLLSKRIHSELDIKRLGVNGLGMEAHVVDKCVRRNTKDLETAMYEVLKAWYITHESRSQAYANLCTAIRKVNMDFLIEEVLESEDHDFGYLAHLEIGSKLRSFKNYCLEIRISNGLMKIDFF